MTQFRHVGIVLNNINATLRIWTEVLDFVVISRRIENGSPVEKLIGIEGVSLESVKIASRTDNRICVEFLSFINPTSVYRKPKTVPNSYGITHLALTVDNLPNVVKKLYEYGVVLIGEISVSDDGKSQGVYTEFPENILIELVEEIVE